MTDPKTEENRIRKLAQRKGYLVHKSRQRNNVPHMDNFGDYMLVDRYTKFCVMGDRYNASLADIEAYLTDLERTA
jgi:hypothetical protein